MPTNTKKTETRRKAKKSNNGKKRKKQQAKMSTPVFPVHTEKSE
jgi:hypothetical protein